MQPSTIHLPNFKVLFLSLSRYGRDIKGEKEKRTSKKTWMERVQAAM